ncbi:MAG: glycosyltransferase family 4 protein [Planctomycetota bacterium]
MRIGVITNRNLCSPWASTHFYIYRALRRLGIDAVHIAGKEIAAHHSRYNIRRNGRKNSGKQPAPFTRELTEAIRQDIDRNSYDAIIALHASTVIPALEIRCPLIYVTDATAALLNDYYPKRQELSSHDVQWLHECEQTTLSRSDAVVVPTQWAADSALQDYAATPSRIHVIEWGGNIDNLPDLTDKVRHREGESVRFLFVGLDWERKGGDIATETIELLQASGIQATLTVVGAQIPRKHRSPFVRSVGMLNRANPDESEQLDQLFQSADFYIHPARAECYGHVLCEALGFGIPVIASQTGGISQCVIDGETGVLLPPESLPEDYAENVQALLANRGLLEEMQTNAVLDFRKRLNWDHWASRTQQVVQELLSPTVSTSSD